MHHFLSHKVLTINQLTTLDKRYTSSSIAKMILSRLAFSAAVVAGQYADYYNNYADLDIDSIDKGNPV